MNSHLDDKIHSLSRRGETKVDGNVETRNERELKPSGICDGLEISRGTRSVEKRLVTASDSKSNYAE